MQIEQIDRDAAQSILDTWWNRSKIEAILAEHRLAALSARPADDMVERVARAIMSSAHTFPEQAKVYMGYGQAAHAARAAIAAMSCADMGKGEG